MSSLRGILFIAATALLCACSNDENSGSNNGGDETQVAPGFSGIYGDKPISYEFTPERVYITALGATSATNYELDGNRVLVGVEGGQQVLTIRADGSLEAAMGTILQKHRSAIELADRQTFPDTVNPGSPSDVAETYMLAMATYDIYAALDNTIAGEISHFLTPYDSITSSFHAAHAGLNLARSSVPDNLEEILGEQKKVPAAWTPEIVHLYLG